MDLYLFCIFLFFICKGIKSETVFVGKWTKKCLVCPFANSVSEISWTGPPGESVYVNKGQINQNIRSIELDTSTEESILCIRNMTDTYYGEYRCSGPITFIEYIYTVKLEIFPTNMVIVNKSRDNTILCRERDALIVECKISQGKPVGVLRWRSEDRTLAWDRKDMIRFFLKSTVAINNTHYTCEALSDSGAVVLSESVTLIVYALPPSIPANVRYIEYETKLFVYWEPGPLTSQARQSYIVLYKKRGKFQWSSKTDITVTFVYLKNLEPSTVYIVKIYAINAGGVGNSTNEITITTSTNNTEDKTTNSWQLVLVVISLVCSLFAVTIIGIVFRRRCIGIITKRFQSSNEVTVVSRTQSINSSFTDHYEEIESSMHHLQPDFQAVSSDATIPFSFVPQNEFGSLIQQLDIQTASDCLSYLPPSILNMPFEQNRLDLNSIDRIQWPTHHYKDSLGYLRPSNSNLLGVQQQIISDQIYRPRSIILRNIEYDMLGYLTPVSIFVTNHSHPHHAISRHSSVSSSDDSETFIKSNSEYELLRTNALFLPIYDVTKNSSL